MLLEFRRLLDPALPHRNRRAAQAAVLLAVVLMLFLAFRLAVVRGFDHTIGTDAWGRMLFGIGSVITEQSLGIGGYVVSSSVEAALGDSGITGAPARLEKLDRKFPENLRDPVLIDKAIATASNYRGLAGRLRGPSGDDPGFVDYVKLSFALFGPHLLSLFLTYFVLLGIEAACFFVAFRDQPACLSLLCIALFAQICVIGSNLFDFENSGLGSVNNPRFLSVLAIIPALHAAMLAIRPERLLLGSLLPLVIQALIAALALWIRASAVWVVAGLVLLAAWLLLIHLRANGRREWRSGVVRLFPVALFLLVLGAHAGYCRANLNPVYHQQNDVSYHPLWHAVLFSLEYNPELSTRFGALFDGRSGDEISVGAAAAYLRKHPEAARPDDYLDGLHSPEALTKAAVERYARAVFFEILSGDPAFVLKTFLYYKPRSFLLEFVGHKGLLASALDRLSRPMIVSGLLFGLFLAVGLAHLPQTRRELLAIAAIASVGFAISSLPVLLTVPYWPALADQLQVLLIALGAWLIWGMAAAAAFCRRALASPVPST